MSLAQQIHQAHQFTVRNNRMVFGELISCSCGWGHYIPIRREGFDWEPVKQGHLAQEWSQALEAGLIRELLTEGLKSYELPD